MKVWETLLWLFVCFTEQLEQEGIQFTFRYFQFIQYMPWKNTKMANLRGFKPDFTFLLKGNRINFLTITISQLNR